MNEFESLIKRCRSTFLLPFYSFLLYRDLCSPCKLTFLDPSVFARVFRFMKPHNVDFFCANCMRVLRFMQPLQTNFPPIHSTDGCLIYVTNGNRLFECFDFIQPLQVQFSSPIRVFRFMKILQVGFSSPT